MVDKEIGLGETINGLENVQANEVNNKYYQDIIDAEINAEKIKDEYLTSIQTLQASLASDNNINKETIKKIETDFNKEINAIDDKVNKHNESIEKKLVEINQKKEDELASLSKAFLEQKAKNENILIENEMQYRNRIDELNHARDKYEDDNIQKRNALRENTLNQQVPIKETGLQELKSIENVVNQTRDDANNALAVLKRKYDADVRQVTKVIAKANETYNLQFNAVKEEYNNEIAKIEEKEEIRRQQLHLQLDALKLQYEDEKSKALKLSVEAIAMGDKRKAKELKNKAIQTEKTFQQNLTSEQKDAEVDFKAIEEQRKIAKTNLDTKLKEYKLKQQAILDENAHILRVLQYRYESEIQKKNLSKEIVENELSERTFKQENANRLALLSISIKGEIKDRELVYDLNQYTLNYNKANNENYIDYQCFKINQEFLQTVLKLNYDLDLKQVQMKYKKDVFTINKQKDIENLKLEVAKKTAYIDYYYALYQLDLKKLESDFSIAKQIKINNSSAKTDRIKVTIAPYINKLELEYSHLKTKYEALIENENLEYNESIRQIELAHEREIKYLQDKIIEVELYKAGFANDIKAQLDNLILASNNRYRIVSEEVTRNHMKIIKGYESKIQEAQLRLEAEKNKYYDANIVPIINEANSATNLAFENEYNSYIANYKGLHDLFKVKVENEKVDLQRGLQATINNLTLEFNRSIETNEIEFRNYKMQIDARIKEEETVKVTRLSEIEKNRQSANNDYLQAKANAQKQFENDIAVIESKLSSLEQEINRSNANKAQNTIRNNGELLRSINNIETATEKQIQISKNALDKSLRNRQ